MIMVLREKIRTILIFAVLFVLFYNEPVKIGPLSFSQIWKIPLFLFLFWQVVVLGKEQSPGFIKWSYARAGKNLFNKGFLIDLMAEISDFIRYMMFPLMYGFATKKIKSIAHIDKLLLGFAHFVILSGIPFLLGILQSKGKELSDMAAYEDVDTFTGIFQNPHSASITTTTAVIIILALIKSKSKQLVYKRFNLLIAAFGMYLIYLTFVRTGYLMFIIGVLFIFKPQKFSIPQITISIFVGALLVFGFLYLLETSEFFYNRIFDIRDGKQTAVGSGRFDIWKAAWELWVNGNFIELLFGFGLEELKEGVRRGVGISVYAHNEFLTQLGQNGLLGLIFVIGYLVSLFKFIWRRRKSSSFKLAFTIYCLYFALMLTQGGAWFPLDVFMVLVYLRLNMEQKAISEIDIQFGLQKLPVT